MIIGPKYKIGKRLGAAVFEKCQTQKFMLSEARSKKRQGKRPRQMSDFGRQLLEKQKIRFMYGMTEKQFSRYVFEAMGSATDPAQKLYQSLEMRLDNLVYRLGLAPTRRAARQMVSHGHILIDGRKMTIPSFQAKAGTKVSIRPQSVLKGLFATLVEYLSNHQSPKWLSFDAGTHEGIVTTLPKFSQADSGLDLQLVLQFYSR